MRHEAVATVDVEPVVLGSSRVATMPPVVIPADLEWQRAVLEDIDATARQHVEVLILEMQDSEPGIDVVGTLWGRVARYSKNGLTWLAETNRDLALALTLDPRLAVLTHMLASAETAVIAARRNGEMACDRRMAIDTFGRLVRSQALRRRAAA
jgi:hypothetical protein